MEYKEENLVWQLVDRVPIWLESGLGNQTRQLAVHCSGHRKARGRGEGSVGEGGEGQEGEEVSLLRDEGHRHDHDGGGGGDHGHDGGGGGGDEKKDEEKS